MGCTCSTDGEGEREREINTIFWLENMKGRDHSEDLCVDGKITLKWILGKLCEKVWTGFIWHGIVTTDGLL
jgi:hypothetical protein